MATKLINADAFDINARNNSNLRFKIDIDGLSLENVTPKMQVLLKNGQKVSFDSYLTIEEINGVNFIILDVPASILGNIGYSGVYDFVIEYDENRQDVIFSGNFNLKMGVTQ